MCNRNGAASCSTALYPTSNSMMADVAAAVGVPCISYQSSYYVRPHVDGGTCYFGTTQLTCDSSSINGWMPICYCPQPTPSITSTLSTGVLTSRTFTFLRVCDKRC